MKLLLLTLLTVALATLGSAGRRKDQVNCQVSDDFNCAKLKKCRGSENFTALKKSCHMAEHNRRLDELAEIFNGPVMTRKPRMIEPLETGYSVESAVREGASCSVGGGTIMTFDGYSHTLTAGPCTYALTLDRDISKLVVYGSFESYKGGKFANRLKEIAIYVEKTSLVLGEDFDINYQGIGYNAPARVNDKVVIWRDEHYVYAEAESVGALIRWDPAGQLKITVDSKHQNELMGLCGMYNSDNSADGEHNSLKHAYGSPGMTSHEFGKVWALSGCYHEDAGRVKERERNCDTALFTRLCSVTHAAPGLAACLRDKDTGPRYQEECLRNLCLCDDIDSCMYTETLRISNDCYDRLNRKIPNADLRSYLDREYIQNFLPRDHQEVPTEEIGPDNLDSSHGEPYSYQDFEPAGSCYVYGHNHIQTFDGVSYQSDAHGCTYPLALRAGIRDFAVYGTFQAEQPSGHLASHLTYVSFFDIKNRVRVQLGQGLEVNYEGRTVPLPYNREFLSIWYNDDEHQVYIYAHDVGVEVRWDGESTVRIRIDDRYHDETKGLCGTFNDNNEDEINLLKDTRLTPTSYQIMVQEWKLPNCGFNADLYGDPAQCVPSLQDYGLCRTALTDVKFSFCVTDLPAIHFIERCEKDLCRCVDDEECKCEIVSAYAQMCEDSIGARLNWRSEDFCPRNLCHFDNNGCKHTCTPPGVCSCDPGFVLGQDGKSCLVEIEQWN